ncbi:BTAD domain-containing putative transcriptional regulator [Polymorphospora rubra]|uniref:AfsR/SARP family transcriptional regulator n=1 Tax=Polymorphospora rubra TaxID=338584 RepID=UPI0033EE88EC
MTALRFLLLGPLDVQVDGRPVPLGSVKQRLLCASLLLSPNERVPVGQLIDLLWDDPPTSATANLRTYAHGLRRILRDGSDTDGRLHTRTGGYLLDVRPGERDVDEFHDAARRGRDALDAGDLAAAETGLAHALAVWRGSPLVGLPLPPPLASRVARLEEHRLTVEEDHIQVKLELGGAAELIGRLRRHVEEHPLRQRGWGQLMTALYRTGDVAGAVDAYLRARRALTDQTGLDPSPWLDRLYQDILHHEPGLLAERPEPTAVPVPAVRRPAVRQLPSGIDDLVGRRAEISSALDRLDGSAASPVVALHGPAGVGKSALAIHLAAQVQSRYPDGTLYVDLQGSDANLPPLTPVDVLGRFLRALGVADNTAQSSLGEATAAYRTALAGRAVLVVLDNARDAAQVKALLPADRSCATLITSRRMLATLPNSRHVAVDVLPAAEALALLATDCGTDRVSAQPAAARRLVDLCGRLPLAIRIVGARLASRPGWPLDRLVERLDDPRIRLDELEFDDLGVRPSIRVTYEALEAGTVRDRRAAAAFRLLGTVTLPAVTGRAAAALLDEPPAAAEHVLDHLADHRLIEPRRPGTYVVHDLVRLFAVEQATAEPHGERSTALRRLLDMYLHGARDIERLANAGWSPAGARQPGTAGRHEPPTTAAEATAWLADEHANIVASFTLGAAADRDTAAVAASLAWASVAALRRHGYWHEAYEIIDGAVAMTARLELTLERSAALFYRASLRKGAGDPRQAETDLLECLDLIRSIGDPDRTSACLEALGNLHYRMGRVASALAHHDEALAVRRALGKPLLIGASLSNAAQVRLSAGAAEQAFADVEEALRIAAEIDAAGLEGAALSMRGQLLCRSGRWSQALSCLDSAVAATERSGDLPSRCEAYLCAAAARLRLDEPKAARRAADRAAELAHRTGDRYMLAVARQAASRAEAAAGDAAAASRLAEAARALARSTPGCREPQYEEFFGHL